MNRSLTLLCAAAVLAFGLANHADARDKTHTIKVDKDLVKQSCGDKTVACTWCNAISCSFVSSCKGSKCKVIVTTNVARTAPGGTVLETNGSVLDRPRGVGASSVAPTGAPGGGGAPAGSGLR